MKHGNIDDDEEDLELLMLENKVELNMSLMIIKDRIIIVEVVSTIEEVVILIAKWND